MNPPLPQRSKSESLFMAMPLVFAGLLISAVGVLFFLVWRGGEASGARVKIDFAIHCENPDIVRTQNILQKRIEEIGLGDPYIEVMTKDSLPVISLQATLPGLEEDQEKIPIVLSRRGELVIKDAKGSILATKDNLKNTALALDESGMPYVGLFLDLSALSKMSKYVSENPQSYMQIFVDNELAAKRPNTVLVQAEKDFEIRVISEKGDVRQRFQMAADRSIVLSHPSYPCDMEVVSLSEIKKKEK
jgi:hypothetical protein